MKLKTMRLLGGASPQSCSNYALKKTSTDRQQQFGEDAAKTIQRNYFYMDDMLKSTVYIETVTDLIMKVRILCETGDFNLTNFVSIKMEVMQAIPQKHPRKNVNIKKFLQLLIV